MIRAVMVAVATVTACTVLLAGVGAGIGWAVGTYSPGYYRSVFRSGNEPWFDPVAVGVGLGLTQGVAGGVVVGLAVVAILTWREVRLHRLATPDAEPGAAADRGRMRNRPTLLYGTLLLCLLGVLAIAVIQLLDKEGRLNPHSFTGHIVVLASPFFGVAAAAGWWRAHRWLPFAALGVAAVCVAVGLWGNLADYISWSRTPPGREVMHFGAFIGMLWSWLLCLGLVATGLVAWGVGWWQRGRAEPGAAADGGA